MIAIIAYIVVGLIIGALAYLLKSGEQTLGLPALLVLGLAGSLLGGGGASALGRGDICELNALGFIVAVITPVALIGVAEVLVGSQRSHPEAP